MTGAVGIESGSVTTRVSAPATAHTRRLAGVKLTQVALDHDRHSAPAVSLELVRMLGLHIGNAGHVGRLAPDTSPQLALRDPVVVRTGSYSGQRKPILHGTVEGFRRHVELAEPACNACTLANARQAAELSRGQQPTTRFIEPINSSEEH